MLHDKNKIDEAYFNWKYTNPLSIRSELSSQLVWKNKLAQMILI